MYFAVVEFLLLFFFFAKLYSCIILKLFTQFPKFVFGEKYDL